MSIQGQKDRHKARSADQERVTGIRPDKDNKTTGLAAVVQLMQKRSFAEVEEHATHICDIAGYINDVRQTMNRTLTMTIVVPNEYGHEVLDAHNASSLGFAMFRLYVVPRGDFEDPDDGDDGDGGGDDAWSVE